MNTNKHEWLHCSRTSDRRVISLREYLLRDDGRQLIEQLPLRLSFVFIRVHSWFSRSLSSRCHGVIA